MARRDGSSYTWTSQEHTFFTGQVFGQLMKGSAESGWKVEPVLTANDDYTAATDVLVGGKRFRVIVAEIE